MNRKKIMMDSVKRAEKVTYIKPVRVPLGRPRDIDALVRIIHAVAENENEYPDQLHPIKNAWELDKREKTAKMLLLRAVRQYREILGIQPQRHFSGFYEHALERIDRKWRMG
jgi:hypothetical protein